MKDKTLLKIRNHFMFNDKRFNKWRLWRPFYGFTWQLLQSSSYDHMINYINSLEGETILDIGTGTGTYIRGLKPENNNKIIFTDLDPKAIAIAKKKSNSKSSYSFVAMDAITAVKTFSDSRHVILAHVFSVIEDPSEFLAVCKKTLSPDTTLLIYLSVLNGCKMMDSLSKLFGFAQIDSKQTLAGFKVHSVGKLNRVFMVKVNEIQV